MKASAALAPALRDAARVVARVANGRSLNDAYDEALPAGAGSARAAVIDLTHGTLRAYGRVQAAVKALSKRGQAQPRVEALLWCALHALDSGRYQPYTVVDQAVRACGLLEVWNAKGYVNALLRAYLRERDAIEASIAADEEARYQYPQWWIARVREAYPLQWREILRQGNAHPPMALRVNARRASRDDVLAQLAAQGSAARPVGTHGVLLEPPLPVERLPGFAEGRLSVQDAGAQRAAPCLDLAHGQRVLDACAAPGGKAAHILETAQVELTALDESAPRLARLARNFARLGLAADVRTADAAALASWWDGRPFDRILADVPCSASGVARRYPDLKWLRRAQDLEAFARRQAALLDALWRTLRAGGKLLYVTCSLFPQENEAVTGEFLARTAGAARLPLSDGQEAQWLPDAEHDGFYYALFQKTD
ncbi:MAG: 16S rRNA (cytosine(967)-C(5))-methyltransferase RsmB [Betaproteobacteria bacterium]